MASAFFVVPPRLLCLNFKLSSVKLPILATSEGFWYKKGKVEGARASFTVNPLWPENFDLQNNFLSLGSSFLVEILMETAEREKRFKIGLNKLFLLYSVKE